MTHIFLKTVKLSLPCFTLFIAFLTSCTTEKSTENKDSTIANQPINERNEVEMINIKSDVVQAILLDGNNKERLNNLGLDIQKISASEELTVEETSNNYISFSQYFNDSETEFVDIQYFHANSVVTGINFEIFLDEANSVERLFADLEVYFNIKFNKKGVKSNNQVAWQTADNTIVTLKDVSLKLAPGLELRFAQKGENFKTSI
jgi:hypothetical protein